MARTRNNRIDIMLSDEEYAKLKSDTYRAKISQAEYIRRLILNKRIREKPDDRFYDVMFQLTHIGNNLNQIAHKANYLNDIDKEYYESEAKNWCEFMNNVKREYL
jgi:hypothetical protein